MKKHYRVLPNDREVSYVDIIADSYDFYTDVLEFRCNGEVVGVFLSLEIFGFVLVDEEVEQPDCNPE